MKIKEKLSDLHDAFNNKFSSQFGFKFRDATFLKLVDYLHSPRDSSSLAVTRILFGVAMLFDIADERGGSTMEQRWGDPKTCHFPLLPYIRAMPMPYMAVVYAGLWFGALGIMLGYKYRYTAATFTLCYWYLFLIEKSFWNNHSYLFGLLALLLTFTEANCCWSIDAYQDPSKIKISVPYWNYFILKYQLFILYFMAGMKKGTAEWLTGYSVQKLSEHWVFAPFRLFLTVPQTDYLIVHWFVFLFDLTVAVWMMCSSTRNVAMVLCGTFHLMNSRLFRIGMFPWVCLATMPLFYPFSWPKTLLENIIIFKTFISQRLAELTVPTCDCQLVEGTNHCEEDNNFENINNSNIHNMQTNNDCVDDNDDTRNVNEDKDDLSVYNQELFEESHELNGEEDITEENFKRDEYKRKKLTVYFIMFHVISQAFLPYSHFITLGYNNWTNGLYGYSWDMMVHTWDTHAVIVQVTDNENNKDYYIDPYIYTPNERWTRHGDMVHQYAKCLRNNLKDYSLKNENNQRIISENISIYVDVWCSMNGRFTQRIFDPKADLLKANWQPFEKMPYVMPLLDDALDWRVELDKMEEDVHSWNENSDVIFFADFSGYGQEKFISEELQNVTLIVLDGTVAYQPETTQLLDGYSEKLTSGDRIPVANGRFHKVLNIGQFPAYYMYTFFNNTEVEDAKETPKLPILIELYIRFYKMYSFFYLLVQNLLKMFTCFTCTN